VIRLGIFCVRRSITADTIRITDKNIMGKFSIFEKPEPFRF